MYEMRNVLFLLDENDTIGAYEARGKAKPAKTSYQQSLEALSKLHHVQQVDMIQGQCHYPSLISYFSPRVEIILRIF